jgi:hypothetical protein
MLANQRWRQRKAFFRRPDEQIRPADYEVTQLADVSLAKPFICAHHYSGTFPSSRFRFGLFRGPELVGVANFGVPMHNAVLTNLFGGKPTESVELNRFVLLDSVPGNGETWFLARCLKVLRRLGLRGVVSFSDPVPRLDLHGRTVFIGHVGTIYQAGNALFLGRGSACQTYLLPDGRVFSKRLLSKIRNGEQGRDYAIRQLLAHGADDPARTVDGRYASHAAWLEHWLPLLTTRFRHPGNYKYAFPFEPSLRSELSLQGMCYPKSLSKK